MTREPVAPQEVISDAARLADEIERCERDFLDAQKGSDRKLAADRLEILKATLVVNRKTIKRVLRENYAMRRDRINTLALVMTREQRLVHWRQLLKDAELFLRAGANYAPDQPVSDQNKATGEWLKTRGLATTMLRVADAIKATIAESDQNAAGQVTETKSTGTAEALRTSVTAAPKGEQEGT